MLIDICELLYDCQLVNTQNGQTLFKDFIMDQRMAMLYEKFILNFYKKELVTNKVYSPHINWDLDRDYDHYGINLLPIMRTDIVIENGSRQLIIDAKYYSSALQSRNLGGTKKLISSNLYQIYTYLNNSKFNGDISGMLLYPVVDTELDLEFSIQGKVILVKTLNLDTNWSNIKKRLLDIIF
jgi:5-methylcytosine-specific restriction enzyme subunit McrC